METLVVIRASELDRVISCPGSMVLTPLVDGRQGDEGWEGSMIHFEIATRLINELGAIPPDGGLPPPDVPKGYKLPAFSKWIVEWGVRHARETVPADWSLMVELPLAYSYERWTNSGHIDWVAINPDATECIADDWKSGIVAVDPADNNEQAASYLCLLKRAWPTLRKGTFQICQPRLDEDDGFQRISSVVVEDLDALVASMDARVCAALDNSDQLSTGRKSCTYCPAAPQCPAIKALREEMKLKLTAQHLAAIRKTPDDATLAEWAIAAKTLSKPIEDVMELAKERIAASGSIEAPDGTVITAKISGGHYTVTDPVAFLAGFRSLAPSDESIAKCFKPRMAEIRDEIAITQNLPKTAKMGMSATTVFDATLKPLTTQGTKTTLIFT